MSVPGKIKARRSALALTQAQAAERIGWTQPVWQSYESGKRLPTAGGTLKKIAKAMKCKEADLL